jgi:hypothetical protein
MSRSTRRINTVSIDHFGDHLRLWEEPTAPEPNLGDRSVRAAYPPNALTVATGSARHLDPAAILPRHQELRSERSRLPRESTCHAGSGWS